MEGNREMSCFLCEIKAFRSTLHWRERRESRNFNYIDSPHIDITRYSSDSGFLPLNEAYGVMVGFGDCGVCRPT